MHDYPSEFADVAERVAVTIARSDLGVPVPGCPRWSTYDLIVHLGNVHAWAATIVETGRRAQEQDDQPAVREPVAVSEWYAAKAEDLYEVLRAADPAAECWNFTAAEPRARFWSRRQLHETAMHLVDLEQSRGHEPALSPAQCADGIDEVLTTFVPLMRSRGRVSPLTARLTFRASDVARTWTLQPTADGAPARARGTATASGGDVVEGPAAALWKLLWKRAGRSSADGSLLLTHPEVSYVGDQDRITAFVASRLTP